MAKTSKKQIRAYPRKSEPSSSSEDEPEETKIDENSDEVEDEEDTMIDDEEDKSSDEEPDSEEELGENLQMTTMPLSKLREMKEKLGVKLFNKIYLGEAPDAKKKKEEQDEEPAPSGSKPKFIPRSNPKRPREESSKKPVSKKRNIFANEKIGRKSLDPRFDDRYGKYDEYYFDRNYKFLEEIRDEESNVLKEELKEAKKADPYKAERLKRELKKRDDQKRAKKLREDEAETMRALRKENIERMKQGLKPVFKTRGEVKMLNQEKKFKRLKKERKLDKYMERKSKKQNRKAERFRPAAEEE